MRVEQRGEAVAIIDGGGCEHLLTPGEAQGLAEALSVAARRSKMAIQAKAREERRAKVEADHPGGHWVTDWNRRVWVVLGERGPEGYDLDERACSAGWQDLPPDTPDVRIRLYGGRVAHVWRGKSTLCGMMWVDAEIAGLDLPLCKACARVLTEASP